MKKTLEALEALCRSAPGIDSLSISLTVDGEAMFSISCSSNKQVHALAAEFGGKVRIASDATHEWLHALATGPLWVSVHGPHRHRRTEAS